MLREHRPAERLDERIASITAHVYNTRSSTV
jgi:hypothetical protein